MSVSEREGERGGREAAERACAARKATTLDSLAPASSASAQATPQAQNTTREACGSVRNTAATPHISHSMRSVRPSCSSALRSTKEWKSKS